MKLGNTSAYVREDTMNRYTSSEEVVILNTLNYVTIFIYLFIFIYSQRLMTSLHIPNNTDYTPPPGEGKGLVWIPKYFTAIFRKIGLDHEIKGVKRRTKKNIYSKRTHYEINK